MKHLLISLLVLVPLTFFISCGSNNKSNVALTPEMESFMDMLDGKYQSVDAAIQKYRATDTLATCDMDIKDLQDPEVQSGVIDGDITCYVLKVNDKAKDCEYELCWKNGKLISISDRTVN